ncbi:MAG: hypothetical protein WBE37_18175 [Bryobacteraceae bacterium]
MPRSTASGLRITPAVAAIYNYQIDLPLVEAEVNIYAKGAPARQDFTGFQSRKQREEDERSRETPETHLDLTTTH